MDFEKLLTELNEVANKMEDKQTTVEESFKLFDYGLKLSEDAAKLLSDYSKRFDALKQKWAEIDLGLNNDD